MKNAESRQNDVTLASEVRDDQDATMEAKKLASKFDDGARTLLFEAPSPQKRSESEAQQIPPRGSMYPGCFGRVYDAREMYLVLKGFFLGREMYMALQALGDMRRHHEAHYRACGQPYEVHPLMMAMHAMSLAGHKHITETTFAIILLHDVPEELNISIEEMPYPYSVQRGLKYITKTGFKGETKYELRRRYINELLDGLDVVITKAIDRYCNLKTMIGALPTRRVCRNVVETDMLLLPVLKQAQEKWPEASNLLEVLINDVRTCNDLLAFCHRIKLTDKHIINRPDALDFSYLITGEEPPREVMEWRREQKLLSDCYETMILPQRDATIQSEEPLRVVEEQSCSDE